jgi:capsular exopolysaccharide synthesis family protein
MADNPVTPPDGTFGNRFGEEQILPIQQYWHVILKRIWMILLIFVAVFSLVSVYTFKQRKVYEARTSLIIDLAAPRVLGNDVQPVVDIAPAGLNADHYFKTQYRIIKSRKIAERVVEKLGVSDDLVFLELDHIQDEEELKKELADIDPVDKLLSVTEVDPAIKTHIVIIKVRHSNPDLAARLANGVAETYKAYNLEQRRESTYGAYDWLTAQYHDVKEKLQGSDKALFEFKKGNNILSTSLEDRQSIAGQRLVDLNRQLTDIQGQRRAAQAEVAGIRRLGRGAKLNVAVSEVINNPLVQNLKTTLADLRRREAGLRGRYLDDYPEVVSTRKQIVTVEAELATETETILASAENRLRRFRDQEAALITAIEVLKQEALALNEKELVYTQLVRDAQTNSRLYDLVLKRLKETDISRLLQDNNIRILDYALVPDDPVMPKVPLNLLIGALLGLVLGVGLAFMAEVLDSTIKTQEDVEGLLGLPFLGVIPTIKATSAGPDRGRPLPDGEARDLHVFDFPKSMVAECCRTIRTNILFMSPEQKIRRLLITSAGPREGKTVTSVNIATVMSQSNARVLLVDTDMRRPRVHRCFGMENHVGLSSLILGEVDYDDAIHSTPVPNLDVLLCGPVPPNPAELMLTERFRAILSELDERYDIVILDSPPTIAVTDSMILSQMVDGLLLVVKGGQTSKAIVRKAVSRLRGVNAPILGCVVNDVDLENRRYGHYSYYYRHYGKYYSEEAEPV